MVCCTLTLWNGQADVLEVLLCKISILGYWLWLFNVLKSFAENFRLLTIIYTSSSQVLFLMYHYFAATEIYNAIRVFIAAYVWMTGFGNFSYYYIRKDFSLARFAQVSYLLHFLSVFTRLSEDSFLYKFYLSFSFYYSWTKIHLFFNHGFKSRWCGG